MSSSKRSSYSSSSVKNPYRSSFNSFKTKQENSSDFDYHFCGIKCKCDIVSPCQEAWREGTLDPGQRFFECSRYKDPSKRCNFFLWVDPPYPDRAREVINDLKMKVKKKDEERLQTVVDLNFVEKKMLVLHEECVALEKKKDEAVKKLQKKEKEMFKLKFLMLVVFLGLLVKLFS